MRLSVLICALSAFVSSPALAGEQRAFEGATIWSDDSYGAIWDQGDKCGLDREKLVIFLEVYTVTPQGADEEAALDAKVAQIAAATGFGSDPADNQVSREFIRNLLMSRTILDLEYEGKGAAKGFSCLTEWLSTEGFSPITPAEVDAIVNSHQNAR